MSTSFAHTHSHMSIGHNNVTASTTRNIHRRAEKSSDDTHTHTLTRKICVHVWVSSVVVVVVGTSTASTVVVKRRSLHILEVSVRISAIIYFTTKSQQFFFSLSLPIAVASVCVDWIEISKCKYLMLGDREAKEKIEIDINSKSFSARTEQAKTKWNSNATNERQTNSRNRCEK